MLPSDAITAAEPRDVVSRPRRLRRTSALRALVAETSLDASHLVHPMFIREGRGIVQPVASLPGHAQHSVDALGPQVDHLISTGIPAVLLFGIPDVKDAEGSRASDEDGPVPRAIEAIRRQAPHLVIMADVCLCEYTSHGHCGVLDASHAVDNDATLPLLARAAVAYAGAGADVVAPSAMMDGQVGAIRAALDADSLGGTAIMAYAVKYASAFSGPFREAAGSTPSFGDRRAYQMAPGNVREALREAALDEAEGADLLMVKPAGPCLDIVSRVRNATTLPVAAYQVSGEYAMIKAAAANGWIDERAAALESLLGIRRAGADVIITYFARDAARWFREGA
jgi:porphobilinogen synthase